eukprot:30612-Pelagococcus_subviridis.AAC.12
MRPPSFATPARVVLAMNGLPRFFSASEFLCSASNTARVCFSMRANAASRCASSSFGSPSLHGSRGASTPRSGHSGSSFPAGLAGAAAASSSSFAKTSSANDTSREPSAATSCARDSSGIGASADGDDEVSSFPLPTLPFARSRCPALTFSGTLRAHTSTHPTIALAAIAALASIDANPPKPAVAPDAVARHRDHSPTVHARW